MNDELNGTLLYDLHRARVAADIRRANSLRNRILAFWYGIGDDGADYQPPGKDGGLGDVVFAGKLPT